MVAVAIVFITKHGIGVFLLVASLLAASYLNLLHHRELAYLDEVVVRHLLGAPPAFDLVGKDGLEVLEEGAEEFEAATVD